MSLMMFGTLLGGVIVVGGIVWWIVSSLALGVAWLARQAWRGVSRLWSATPR